MDHRFSLEAKIGMAGLRFPAARFSSLTRLDDYEVNADLPDSLYAGEAGCCASTTAAVARDSTFAGLADKVPLSEREREAYATIDSTLRLERAFRPTGFLARRLLPDMGEEDGKAAVSQSAAKGAGPAAAGGDRLEARSALRPRRGSAPRPGGAPQAWQAAPAAGGRAGFDPGLEPLVPEGPVSPAWRRAAAAAWDLGLKRGSWRGHAAWGWEKEDGPRTRPRATPWSCG